MVGRWSWPFPGPAFQPPLTDEKTAQKAAALRPSSGDRWRVDFSRVEWQHEVIEGKYRKVAGTKEDNWVWSPQGIIDMHRPERWGYVQFVGSATTDEAFKQVAFAADPALGLRDQLMNVYHRQKEFRKTHQRWAKDLKELGIDSDQLTIEFSGDGYVASGKVAVGDGPAQAWHVRQDSRLWRAVPSAPPPK